jgi:alpha/beta superfamily hydrolase
MDNIRTRNGNLLAYSLFRNNPASQDLVILAHGTLGHRHNTFFKTVCEINLVNFLTFDFEGSGGSQGEFHFGGISEEVGAIYDVVCWAKTHGFIVQALLGHSKAATESIIYASIYNDIPLIIPISITYDTKKIPPFLTHLIDEVEEKGMAIFKFKGKDYIIDKKGLEERRSININQHLEKIRCKVILINGSQDPLCTTEDLENYSARLGPFCIKSILLEGADHMFTKHCNQIAAIISNILKELIIKKNPSL